MSHYLIYSLYGWSINATRFVRFTIINLLFFCFLKILDTPCGTIFWILTRKMPKSKESWDCGSVSGTAAVKDKELVTFSLFFPSLFLCFSSQYWMVGDRIIELIKVYYFLFYSLIFSPCFSGFLHRSHWLVRVRAIEGDWIIELIKVNCWSKLGSGFCLMFYYI